MRVLKHFNLLNCTLITVLIIFIYGFLFPRLETDVSFVAPPFIKKPVEKNPYEFLKTQTLSPQEYRAIADQNLFHPDRIIPPEKKPESLLPKPEFILYGTLITPDLKMAYLEDKKAPVTTPGRGQRQSALKIGESLSGFMVKDIQTDKVVMNRGEETLQIPLQEPGSTKARETSPGLKLPIPTPGTPAPVPAPVFPQPGRIGPSAPEQRPQTPSQIPGLPTRRRPLPPGS